MATFRTVIPEREGMIVFPGLFWTFPHELESVTGGAVNTQNEYVPLQIGEPTHENNTFFLYFHLSLPYSWFYKTPHEVYFQKS